MTSKRSKVQEVARFHRLEEKPEMSPWTLASAVGISVGGTHYVLTQKDASEKAAITKRFLAHKIEEYGALTSEIDELSNEIGELGLTRKGNWVGSHQNQAANIECCNKAPLTFAFAAQPHEA